MFNLLSMASGSKRVTTGGFFSRRNKCLVVTLMVTMGVLVLFINAGIFTAAPVYTGEPCKLDSIKVQKYIDKKKFAGNWYAAFTKGSNNPLLSSLLEFSDVKINFVYHDDANYTIRSGKHKAIFALH